MYQNNCQILTALLLKLTNKAEIVEKKTMEKGELSMLLYRISLLIPLSNLRKIRDGSDVFSSWGRLFLSKPDSHVN